MSLIARRVLVGVVALAGIVSYIGKAIDGFTGDDLVFGPVGSVLIVVGSILVLRVPENRISWLILTLGASLAVMGVGEAFLDQRSANVLVGILLFAVFLPGLAVLVPLWFPTGSALTPRWSWVGWVCLVGIVLLFAGQGVKAVFEGGGMSDIDYCTSPGTCMSIGGVLAVLGASVAALVSFVVRWRRSDGVERLQLRWLVPSFIVLCVGLLAEFGGFQDSLVALLFGTAGMLMVPLSIGLAITRYRLYDIDRVISRTVSYVLVVGLLGLVFAAGVVMVPNLVPRLDGSPALVAASTLGVAALFNPVRRQVALRVDRRFNRSRYDAERVIQEFAASLRDRVDPDDLVDGWVGVVFETMHPSSAGAWIKR